jgi:thioredoxin-related protein
MNKIVGLNRFVLILSLSLFSAISYGQNSHKDLYNPNANAKDDLANAISKAKNENKHVLVQIGGNWCKWCIEFNRFCKSDSQIDSMIQADYVVYHLNYSKENKNLEILSQYGFPQRFGFPVFIVLNQNGDRLHTENSSYLEEGNSYNKARIMAFLKAWNPKALDPKSYDGK